MNRNMKGVIHCDMLYLAPYGNDRSEGNQGIVLDDTAMCQWQHIQSDRNFLWIDVLDTAWHVISYQLLFKSVFYDKCITS